MQAHRGHASAARHGCITSTTSKQGREAINGMSRVQNPPGCLSRLSAHNDPLHNDINRRRTATAGLRV